VRDGRSHVTILHLFPLVPQARHATKGCNSQFQFLFLAVSRACSLLICADNSLISVKSHCISLHPYHNA
jgi:hypothetical protein